MNDLRKAAEQALEALRYTTDHLPAKSGVEREVDQAITALQVALAQPKREWVRLTDKERAHWHSIGLVGVEIVAAHLEEKNT